MSKDYGFKIIDKAKYGVLSMIEENPKVSIAFIGEVQVPENFTEEELDGIVKDKCI